MRKYIDIVNETIVHFERAMGNNKALTIALSPSKSEWRGRFPNGAAGVLMKDGRVVIGDGSCLAHNEICAFAGLDIQNEKYRLQLGHKAGYAELWVEVDHDDPSPEVLEQAIRKTYGKSSEDIAAEVKAAIRPFAGDISFRAIPMNTDNASAYLKSDGNFMRWCWSKTDEPFTNRGPAPFRDEWMTLARKIIEDGGHFIVRKEDAAVDVKNIMGLPRGDFFKFAQLMIQRRFIEYSHDEDMNIIYRPGSKWSEFLELMSGQ